MQVRPSINRRSWAALASVTVLVFAAGWGLARALTNESSAVPTRAAESTVDATLETRVAKVEAQLERIDTSLARLSGSPRGEAGTRVSGAGLRASMEGANPIEESHLREQTMSEYEQRFQNQALTSRWGQDMTVQLMDNIDSTDVLAVTSALPETFNLDCRADMCRMTFSFSESSDASQWSDAYLGTLGRSVGRIWSAEVTRTDGSTDIVMYGFK